MYIPKASLIGGFCAFITFFVAHWLGMPETGVFWTGMLVGCVVAAILPIRIDER